MNSETVGDAPSRALAYSGPVADPRPLALAAQVLIGVQTVTQLGLAMTGGSRSVLFARTVPVTGLLMMGTIAVFICWFRRCRLNAELFAPGTHRHSPGLAAGAWFIPVAMWWIPRRVALDIWRATGQAGGARLINAWWVAWLAKTLAGMIGAWYEANPGFSPYEQVTGVVAAVLVILVVRQITAAQDAKVRADLAALPFAPAPAV